MVACGFLAQMAFDGEGGEQDRPLARRMYTSLCETSGMADACLLLAVIAENGAGGPRDLDAAYRALGRGCELGNRNACLLLEQRARE